MCGSAISLPPARIDEPCQTVDVAAEPRTVCKQSVEPSYPFRDESHHVAHIEHCEQRADANHIPHPSAETRSRRCCHTKPKTLFFSSVPCIVSNIKLSEESSLTPFSTTKLQKSIHPRNLYSCNLPVSLPDAQSLCPLRIFPIAMN